VAGLEDPGLRDVALGTCLLCSDQLDPHARRDLLTRSRPKEWDPALFVERALGTLAEPELVDPFQPNSELQGVLLDCPDGLAVQPINLFEAVSDVQPIDSPWSSLEMVELLQRAGRWSDGADIAARVLARIPLSTEHAGRHALVALVASAAALEADRTGVEVVPGEEAGSLGVGEEIARRMATVAAVREVLTLVGGSGPLDDVSCLADDLAAHAADVATDGTSRVAFPTELAWSVWAELVGAIAELLRWDMAIRGAESDADRHRLAARRRAEVLCTGTLASAGGDRLLNTLFDVAQAVTGIEEARELVEVAAQLNAVRLPTRIIPQARRTAPPLLSGRSSESPGPGAAVAICRIDGALIANAFVIKPAMVHTLTVEMRLLEWPVEAEALEVDFLSVLGSDLVNLPSFRLARPSPDEDGIFRISHSGPLNITFSLPAGEPPQAFPIAARLVGSGMDQVLPVAGHSELLLRPFDASTDGMTRRPGLDARLVEMYSYLHNMDLDEDDIQAFCRLFTAMLVQVCDLQFERAYGRGATIRERKFHNDLFDRLLTDTDLQGRVTRGNRAAGGFLDILHDRINAELKVERRSPSTVEKSHKYLGQPVDYAADTGAQLSILVILDVTDKDTPPGVLENYVGWMKPALHGRDDPRYPSLVGVIIVNGNLPRPSGYSRGRGGPADPIPPSGAGG
jgi:hypothetical protein